MKVSYTTFLSILYTLLSSSVYSQAIPKPFSHPHFAPSGAHVCASFFALKDAEAAIKINDFKWLDSIGCKVLPGPAPLAVIDERIDFSGGVRVRLLSPSGGVTVYMPSWQLAVWLRFDEVKDPDAVEKSLNDLIAKKDSVLKPLPISVIRYKSEKAIFLGPVLHQSALTACEKARLDKRVQAKCFPTWGKLPTPEPD